MLRPEGGDLPSSLMTRDDLPGSGLAAPDDGVPVIEGHVTTAEGRRPHADEGFPGARHRVRALDDLDPARTRQQDGFHEWLPTFP